MVSLRYQLFYRMKKFTLRLKLGLYKKLIEYAEKNGITVVGAVRFILSQWLNKN